jgi:hypothetical protein
LDAKGRTSLRFRKSDVGQAWIEQVSFVKAWLVAQAASPVGWGYRGFLESKLPSFPKLNFFSHVSIQTKIARFFR